MLSFLIKPDNLHKGLIEIYWEFQLELSVDKFLTVCGKCGGGIAEYPTPASASTTTATYTDHSPVESVMVASAPPLPPQWRERSIPTDRPVYYCVSCHQPYWWNEGESSSPAKAMKKAHLLYEAIKKGLQDKSDMRGEVVNKEVKVDDGHPVEGEKTWLEQAADLSNDLDSTSVSLSALFMNRDRVLASREQPENVSTIQQAQAQESSISGGGLASVFAAGEPLLTNWNGDFQGTLDYIFVSPEWAAQEAKVVPTVDKGLIAREQDIGICSASRSTETVLTHSQPSEFWPSDHLMVVAQLLLT
ncbi:hypothetical protein EON65_31500 [archaeon]|nr:MAG: hypothetical protein EON65_31500 [archaeon]